MRGREQRVAGRDHAHGADQLLAADVLSRNPLAPAFIAS